MKQKGMQISYQWGSFKSNLTAVKGYLVLLEGFTSYVGEKQNKNFLILRPIHYFSWMLLPFSEL